MLYFQSVAAEYYFTLCLIGSENKKTFKKVLNFMKSSITETTERALSIENARFHVTIKKQLITHEK